MMMHGKHHGAMARLTVGGQGLSSAQPDLATISLGVSSRAAATAAEAMTQNAEAQNKVIEALKAGDRGPRHPDLGAEPVADA